MNNSLKSIAFFNILLKTTIYQKWILEQAYFVVQL